MYRKSVLHLLSKDFWYVLKQMQYRFVVHFVTLFFQCDVLNCD